MNKETITNYTFSEEDMCGKLRRLNKLLEGHPKGIYRVHSTDPNGVDGAYHIEPSHTARLKILPDYLATITLIGPEENKKEAKLKLEEFIGFELKEKGR